jgi:GT2 family glycosyltransferase
MEELKKITIVTLTYNNWRHLSSAIRSVYEQKLPDGIYIEYLILDDGTEDFEFGFVNRCVEAKTNKNINCKILQNNKNLGTVASFNKAIQSSTGDVILPLAADDVFYDENVVHDVLNEFIKSNSLVITTLRVPDVNGVEGCSLPAKSEYYLFDNIEKLLHRMSLKGNLISGACTYYRRSLFDDFGGFNEAYFLLEDYPFFLMLLMKGESISLYKRKAIKYGVKGITSNAEKHPALIKDSKMVIDFIQSNHNFNYFESRFFYFNQQLDSKQRKYLINIIFYPEQVLLKFFIRTREYCKVFINNYLTRK